MDKHDILRIIKGECSAEERDAFYERLANDPGLAGLYAEVKNEHVFNTLPYSSNGVFEYNRPTRRLWPMISKIAAIIAIPLLLFTLYDKVFTGHLKDESKTLSIPGQTAAMMTYYVNNGVKGYVVLPDSSRVWLNSGSSLNFPAEFNNIGRVVTLSGEGYFDIQPNKDWPFYIKTPKNILVKVTGTEFNLSCYVNDPALKFTLISGSVELIREESNKKINVRPNEEIIIRDHSSREDNIMNADIGYTTAWKEGYLKFENSPMDEVIRRLERWYGVTIEVSSSEIINYQFTANFESESITRVLELLQISSDISYEIKDNNIRLFLGSGK